MEKHVSDVNNTLDSFSCELHHYNKYGWKHIFKTKTSACRVIGDVCLLIFNKVLVNGKLFFSGQKDLRITH